MSKKQKPLKFLTNEEYDNKKGWEAKKYVEIEALVAELQKRKVQRDTNNEHGSTSPCLACERNEELDWVLALLELKKEKKQDE